MMNVQSDVENVEGDVNNVEIQVNNLENEVNIVESQLINVQEDITDNEDQIFGMHFFLSNYKNLKKIIRMKRIQKLMLKNIKSMQPNLLAILLLSRDLFYEGKHKLYSFALLDLLLNFQVNVAIFIVLRTSSNAFITTTYVVRTRLCFHRHVSFCQQGGVWQGARSHPLPPPPHPTHNTGIRSTSGPYASYWEAFLYLTSFRFGVGCRRPK